MTRYCFLFVFMFCNQLGFAKQARSIEIDRKKFCGSMFSSMESLLAIQSESTFVQSYKQKEFLNQLLEDMKKGSEFFNLKPIMHENYQRDLYIPAAKILSNGFGISKFTILAHSDNDLRFLPHVQKGTEVILITDKVEAISANRVSSVVRSALNNDITVSLVWYGEGTIDNYENGRYLLRVIEQTRGRFVDLSGKGKSCL